MRTLLRNRSLYFLMAAAVALSMTSCSAKSSTDTVETSAEAVTELETEETEDDTISSSNNATEASSNDVSEDAETEDETSEDETEEETLEESAEEEEPKDETEDETESASAPDESETEEEAVTESEFTNSKHSEKDSTKSKTTTSETTTGAVTVQGLSAVVSGTHYVGETLTGADFTVTVTMSDGTVLTNPEGWAASPLTLSSTSNVITVTYKGISTTLTVNAVVAETTAAASSSGSTSTASTGSGSGSSSSSTTDDHEGMVLIDGVWYELSENYGQEEDDYICASGDWSYDYAIALFNAQNDLRTAEGLDALIWDDQCYEVAKLCSKVCSEAGTMDHTLTSQYRCNVYRTTSDGQTIKVTYGENLQADSTPRVDQSLTTTATSSLWLISQSAGHYASVISTYNKYGAVGCYNYHGCMIVSYIFYDGDDYWINNQY